MKTTYLVFENGIGSALRVASKEEWNKILSDNRNVSREHRRFFIQDCFEDCGTMDCLYIETSKEDYDKWHAENQRRYRQRLSYGEIETISLDVSVQTDDGSTMLDIMDDGVNWEEVIIDGMRMRELRVKLASWREWANELLDYYLAGEQMSATKILAEKYGLSEQLIRRRKRELETYVRKFFNFF